MFHSETPEMGNFPPEDDYSSLRSLGKSPPKFGKGHFRLVQITPKVMDLIDTLVDRSADFDRSLVESGNTAHPQVPAKEDDEQCTVAAEEPLRAYGDLIKAKGDLVKYIVVLMDKLDDPNLNARRSLVLRFD